MCLDYQSLTVRILVNIFGVLLVAMVKDSLMCLLVLVLTLQYFLLLHMLAVTITVNQLLGIVAIITHINFNNTLWDGAGCIDNCCDNAKQPWFYPQLGQTTQDDIETRICILGQ